MKMQKGAFMEMGLIYNEMHKKSLRNVLVFQVRSHQNSK